MPIGCRRGILVSVGSSDLMWTGRLGIYYPDYPWLEVGVLKTQTGALEGLSEMHDPSNSSWSRSGLHAVERGMHSVGWEGG